MQAQRYAERRCNGLGDAFLYGEHALEFPIVAFRPQMRAVVRPDKLRRDTDFIPVLAYRAFDKVRRTQRPANGAQILVLAFELERRRPPDHVQIRYLRKRRRDLLRHAVGEEFLPLIAAHVDKRQYRYGMRRQGDGHGGGRSPWSSLGRYQPPRLPASYKDYQHARGRNDPPTMRCRLR